MPQKIKLVDREYEVPELSLEAKNLIESLKFLSNLEKDKQALLKSLLASKDSQIAELKKEILSAKAGFEIQKGNQVPKITVDNIEYNTEDLSANGKAQVASLQFVEAQIGKLKAELAVYQTAKVAYTNALKAELEKLENAS